MKKQSLVKGTLILGVAGITAKFLGLFFRWPLIMLIGDEGVGYYQMSYPLYTFFIAVASGIPVAISKMVSERNAVGDREGIVQVLNKALLLMLIMGSCFAFLMVFFSKQLIYYLRWDEKSYYSMLGIALAPIFISITSSLRGFFQGLQNMNPTAVSQIIEQMGRVVFGVGLAWLLFPMGIEYAAGGAAFGAVAGGSLASIYLGGQYIKLRKNIKVKNTKGDSVLLGKLLYIAVPISVGATVGTIMSLLDSILVPQKLLEAGYTFKESTVLYGQLTGKAFVLINVPLTLSMALCASLVPIIAEAYVLNRRREMINKTELAIRLSMVIGLPAAFGLHFMALPVLSLLFPGRSEGYEILKYLAIAVPFIIMAQTCTAILQGIGRYSVPVVNLFIGCVVKVLITVLLVPMPKINIYGAVIGTIAGYITAASLNLLKLRKILNIQIHYYELLVKPAYASVFMIIAVVFVYQYVYNYTVSNGISCCISLVAGMLVYALFIVILKVFEYNYIKQKFIKR